MKSKQKNIWYSDILKINLIEGTKRSQNVPQEMQSWLSEVIYKQ